MATTQKSTRSRQTKKIPIQTAKSKRKKSGVKATAKKNLQQKSSTPRRSHARGFENMSAKTILALCLGIGAAGVGAMIYANRRKMHEDIDEVQPSSEATQRRAKDKKFGKSSRDRVEEASWESFPASDAPANY